MKKKTLSPNKKLFLEKNTISRLRPSGQSGIVGGARSDATSPCGVCNQSFTCGGNTNVTIPEDICNIAMSKVVSDYHAACNVECRSVQLLLCHTVASSPGGYC